MTDVLTFGEAMVSLRADQPVRTGGALRMSVAGAEANVAIGLARLGHRVRWIGLTGTDEFGALVLRTLRAENVDTSHAAHADGPTGLVVFEPRIADLTRVSYYREGSAGSRLIPAHIEPSLKQGARIVHTTGITAALGRGALDAVEAAVRTAPAAGATVCLDVNYRSKLWSPQQAAAALRPLMPDVDVLVASEDELALAAPAGAVGEAGQVQALLECGVREVVVKRGADGAEVFDASGSTAQQAVAVTVRDTVGAGDAFVAGYLSALLDGEPVAGRLGRAVAVGAFAVASSGDWEGLPTREDLTLLRAAPGSAIR
ncbi:sugar kinase [Streptomyces luteogriseus]|uniref:sugar kinase n=1 Tax=Streptomyces luteogriseus TaxID=68233 RepID=UPI002E301832|nr:sugar kinase [Streptomyces luteogriseus]WTJ25634.1 sugar kinase [Streptomyces luteogriseus]